MPQEGRQEGTIGGVRAKTVASSWTKAVIRLARSSAAVNPKVAHFGQEIADLAVVLLSTVEAPITRTVESHQYVPLRRLLVITPQSPIHGRAPSP